MKLVNSVDDGLLYTEISSSWLTSLIWIVVFFIEEVKI